MCGNPLGCFFTGRDFFSFSRGHHVAVFFFSPSVQLESSRFQMLNSMFDGGRRQTLDECLIVMRKNPESAHENTMLVLRFLRHLKSSREFIKFTVSRFHRAVRLLQVFFRTQLRRYAMIQQNALDKWRLLEMRKAAKTVSVFTCLRDEGNDEDSHARRHVVLAEFRKHRTAFGIRWRSWRKSVLGLEAQLSLTQEELVRLRARGTSASVMGIKALQDRVAYIMTRLDNIQLQRPVLGNMEVNINDLEVRVQQLNRLGHTDKVHTALRQLGIRSEDPKFVETVVHKYEDIVEKERAARRRKSTTLHHHASGQSSTGVPLWLFRGAKPHRPAQRPDLLQALSSVPKPLADKAFDLMYHRHMTTPVEEEQANNVAHRVMPETFVATGFAQAQGRSRRPFGRERSEAADGLGGANDDDVQQRIVDPKTAQLLGSLGLEIDEPLSEHQRFSSRPLSARSAVRVGPSLIAQSPSPRRTIEAATPSRPLPPSPSPRAHQRPLSAKDLASRLKVIHMDPPPVVRPPAPPPKPNRCSTLRAEEKKSNLVLPLSGPFTLQIAPSFIEQQLLKKISQERAEGALQQAEHEHIMASERNRAHAAGGHDVLRVGCATIDSEGHFTFDGVPAAQLHEQNLKLAQQQSAAAAALALAANVSGSFAESQRREASRGNWSPPSTMLEPLPSSLEVRRAVSVLCILETTTQASGQPGGATVVCGCTDGAVRAWSLHTAQEVCNETSCSDRVSVISPVGPAAKWVCAGSDDGTVRVLLTLSSPWSSYATIRTGYWITDLAAVGVSCVAVCSYHSNILLYELDPAQQQDTTRKSPGNTPRAHQKRSIVGPDCPIGDEGAASLLLVLEAHLQGVTCCTTCSSTQNIVSASLDGTAKVWRLDMTRVSISGFGTPPAEPQGAKTISREESAVPVDEEPDDPFEEFAFGAKFSVKSFTGHSAGIVKMLEISPMIFLTASLDGTLRAWDVRSLDTIYRISAPCSMMTSLTALRLLQQQQQQSSPSQAAAIRNTQQVLISCSDGTNAVYHLASGRTLSKIVSPDFAVSSAHVPGQDLVVLGCSKGAVMFAKASTGQPVAWFPGHARSCAIAAVAVFEDLVVVGGEDRQLMMFRVPPVKEAGRKLTGV